MKDDSHVSFIQSNADAGFTLVGSVSLSVGSNVCPRQWNNFKKNHAASADHCVTGVFIIFQLNLTTSRCVDYGHAEPCRLGASKLTRSYFLHLPQGSTRGVEPKITTILSMAPSKPDSYSDNKYAKSSTAVYRARHADAIILSLQGIIW